MSVDCLDCGECQRTYDLGVVDCGDGFAELPFNATMTGTYSAVFRYLGVLIPFEFEGTIGQPILIPITGVNENMRHTVYVVDPDGDKVFWGVYDCFRFVLNKELTPSRLSIPCAPCPSVEGCLFNIVLVVNGEEQEPIEDLDPCEDNTLELTISVE
jgi:hypothetical protein